jgi:hypothetical protein
MRQRLLIAGIVAAALPLAGLGVSISFVRSLRTLILERSTAR